MESVLGVYVGILRMTVFLPFTLWRAWEITKSREFGDTHEVRDGGEDVVIDEQVETGRFEEGLFFEETGEHWIEEKEDIKAVKSEPVTKYIKKIIELQNKQMSQILDRINKLEQEVNAALLLMVNY